MQVAFAGGRTKVLIDCW